MSGHSLLTILKRQTSWKLNNFILNFGKKSFFLRSLMSLFSITERLFNPGPVPTGDMFAIRRENDRYNSIRRNVWLTGALASTVFIGFTVKSIRDLGKGTLKSRMQRNLAMGLALYAVIMVLLTRILKVNNPAHRPKLADPSSTLRSDGGDILEKKGNDVSDAPPCTLKGVSPDLELEDAEFGETAASPLSTAVNNAISSSGTVAKALILNTQASPELSVNPADSPVNPAVPAANPIPWTVRAPEDAPKDAFQEALDKWPGPTFTVFDIAVKNGGNTPWPEGFHAEVGPAPTE